VTTSSTNFVSADGSAVTVIYNYTPIPHFIIPITFAALVLILWWKIRKQH